MTEDEIRAAIEMFQTTVDRRIAELEARVATLEARLGPEA